MTPKAARLVTWRARLPVVAVVIACVAGVIASVTGAANPVSAVQFLLPGHWVYNDALGAVLHIDGATGDVDARGRVPGDAGDQVYQGDTSGYVVGDSRITEFGKSSLEVEGSSTPVARSTPVGVETAGGPYFVYQPEGKVVRFGDDPMVISLGGPVGVPVATKDGTLWLPRTAAGLLCRLGAGSKSPSCSVELPKGHTGALTVVGDRLMFVDTTADTLHTVEKDGLGVGRDLGVDAGDDARLASTDVGGRVAILDGSDMYLVDTAAEPARTQTVDLGDGDYAGPVSTGEVVAVVDKKSDQLDTYDADGTPLESKKLPAEDGDPRITRGEDDRIYVDGEKGDHVVVVDKDGDLTDVPIDEDSGKETEKDKSGETDTPPAEKPDETPPPATDKPDPRTQQPPVENPKPPTQQPKPPTQQPKPPVVPATPPGAPGAVSATAGDAIATVNWQPAPDNRAPITGYTITWPGGRTTAGPGDRAATIGGLVNGTSYVFTVTASNAKGTGPGASSNPVTPVAPFVAATEPTNLAADNDTSASTISASWAAPANMGTGTFVHYLVDVVGYRQDTVTGTSVTYTDLQIDQEITVRVTAVTTDPTGRQVPGQTASVTSGQPVSDMKVVLTRGPATDHPACAGDPNCAWMHVELIGFPPNTDVLVTPHSTDPGYSNEGYTFTTDANGYAADNQFAYYAVGQVVHVNAHVNGETIRSDNLRWEAA